MSAWEEPGPAPPVFTTAVAGVMRRTGRRDTRPELALRRELHRRRLRYLVDTTPPGTNRRRRADLVFRGVRVAVFVDGCFWRSCPGAGLARPRAEDRPLAVRGVRTFGGGCSDGLPAGAPAQDGRRLLLRLTVDGGSTRGRMVRGWWG